MTEIKCPASYINRDNSPSLFLGGGITSCPQWQTEMIDLLKPTQLIIYNPRRDSFDVNDKSMTLSQIQWEHYELTNATARMFWFPCESICPITLFELGKFICDKKPLFVGCHPDYKRRIDLEIQMRLSRPWNRRVYLSLKELANAIVGWDKVTCDTNLG